MVRFENRIKTKLHSEPNRNQPKKKLKLKTHNTSIIYKSYGDANVSGEGEGDKTPNVGDSVVLWVEEVRVSNRVWELGELVKLGNWIFLFFLV